MAHMQWYVGTNWDLISATANLLVEMIYSIVLLHFLYH